MSVEIKVERATMEHAARLAPRMRAADAAEVLASGGYSPIGALEDALLMSGASSWAATFDGEIVGIWGVVPFGLLTGTVIPWLLTSDVVDRHPKDFLRLSRKVVADLRRRHPYMVNMVDARYAAALRWAKRLGFAVDEPVPFGTQGRAFCRITMEGVDHV